jgi:hypothetical protein
MRLRSALIGLLVVASLAPTALAQATPEATLGRFIALANSGELKTPEGQAILTGEAKAMATEAKSNLSAADKFLSVSPTFAAARIVLRSGAGEEADAYFYLEKTATGWAVSAYRQMAPSGMDMMLLAEMRKQRELSPADQIAKKNLELTLSSDSQLRAWFAANRPAIVDLARVHNGAAFPPSPGVTRESHLAASLKVLGLKSIDTQDSATRIVIGGSVDNTVGILLAGASGAPAINPSSYIWIEDLGDGWFLFRTT